MQRTLKKAPVAKTTKEQKQLSKPLKTQAQRKKTTKVKKTSLVSKPTNVTATTPAFMSPIMPQQHFGLLSMPFGSPFSQQHRFMAAKGGKNDKKSDKKGAAAAPGGEAGEGFNSKPFVEKMAGFVEAYENELSNIKVGRATPEMLHDIVVEFGGKKVPLKAIAQVYMKPPASLIVSLHEPSDPLDKAVCNAISGAKMDLNPFSEEVHGVPSIIVPFPKPTKELRESLIKTTKTKAEDTKINIRSQRKLWNDGLKKAGLPKDEAFRGEQDCQKQTDKYVDQVADLAAKKEKEINAV